MMWLRLAGAGVGAKSKVMLMPGPQHRALIAALLKSTVPRLAPGYSMPSAPAAPEEAAKETEDVSEVPRMSFG